jgi:hypothetical protein
MKAKYSQPMSGEKVEDRSTKTAGARISASEAVERRHSRTRQRHRHPKPKTLRCLPSPPSVSPPSAPPCASRAAPPSPRCVSRDAPIEDSCYARTLSRCHAWAVPGTRRPRAVRARRTPRDAVNTPGRERGVAFSGARAHSPRAAVAVRRSRSASRANLGFFSRYRHRKRGVGSPARPLVARADDVPRLERHSHTTRLALGSFGRAPRRARLRDRGAANARPDRLGSDREQRVDRPIDADASCEARNLFFFKEFFADDDPRVHQTPT